MTQADREAAALALGYRNWEDANDYRLSGKQDRERDSIVQAFARHRQAALSELEGERANVEAVAEALHGLSAILLLTGALEDDKTHAAYEKVVTCFATLLGEPQ